jgi:preprotein translocase subunit SecB
MDKAKDAGIGLNSIHLVDLYFKIKKELVKGEKISYAMTLQNDVLKNEGTSLEIKLSADVTSEYLDIIAAIIGRFSINPEQVTINIRQFSTVNAPAIMMPYLREIVYNITGRSPMPPLSLPLINFVESAKEIKPAEEKIEAPETKKEPTE